ncbi:hypothetical protein Tco_0222739 [Tanacetum coccineum]
MTKSYYLFKQPEVIFVFSASNELFQIPHQSPLEQLLIYHLDHDAGPFSVQLTPSSHWQVIYPQVVSNIMKNPSNRYDALRVFVCSVWYQIGDVRSKSLRLGDIKFLLVAFDSQLKVFHPLKDNNASGTSTFQIFKIIVEEVVSKNYLTTLSFNQRQRLAKVKWIFMAFRVVSIKLISYSFITIFKVIFQFHEAFASSFKKVESWSAHQLVERGRRLSWSGNVADLFLSLKHWFLYLHILAR